MIVKIVRIETDEEGDHNETERVGWFKSIRAGLLYMSELKDGGCDDPVPVHEIQAMFVLVD